MNLHSMKLIDKYIGFILCVFIQPFKLFSLNKKTSFKEIDKILILKFWGIGSIMLTSGSLEKIKEKYPNVKIHFLTLKENFQVCQMIKVIDEIITVNLRTNILLLVYEIIKLIIKLRKEKYNLLLDFEFYTRFSSLVSFASGAKCTIGFHSWEIWRGKLHDKEIPFNHYWHIIENFNNLALGSPNRNRNYTDLPKPIIKEKDRRTIHKKLELNNIMLKDYLVVINVNSGELALERRWSMQKFASLCDYLEMSYKIKTIFIGSKSEKPYIQLVIDLMKEKGSVYNWGGELNLLELSALLERANLFITVDSGPLHIATAIGTPTVSFFGPETPVLYGPKDSKHLILFADLSCSPCINVQNLKTVRCRQSRAECMEVITVEKVITEMEKKYEIPRE